MKSGPVSPILLPVARGLCIGVLLLYFLPFLLLGENAYITVTDTLDSEFVYPILLKNSGHLFDFSGNAVIENVLNGLPRSALRSGFSFTLLLFQVIPPYWAYVVNFIWVHLVGFVGMHLLLKKHILTGAGDIPVILTASTLFALVPSYSIYGISFAGQPLIAFWFLNIFKRKSSFSDWAGIALFPFFSFMAFTYPYFLFFLSGLLLFELFRNRKIHLPLIAGTLLLGLSFCVVEIHTIMALFIHKDFIPQRVEFNRALIRDISWIKNLKRACQLLFVTHYHSGTIWTFPTLIAVLFLFLRKEINTLQVRILLLAVLIVLIIYAGYDWFSVTFGHFFPFLKMFQGDRLYVFLPAIWILLFAICLRKFLSQSTSVNHLFLSLMFILFQIYFVLIGNFQFINNVKLLLGIPIEEPAYRSFYSESLFATIREYINKQPDSYRVVCVGMHPSVAQLNGFYTLDGYFDIYPLEYKKKFRKIIAGELDKDDYLKNNFDAWGNRLYVYSSELGFNSLCGKNKTVSIKNLAFNVQAFREMGGEYLFSAVEIGNAGEIGLSLERTFDDPDSYWRVFLYSAQKK